MHIRQTSNSTFLIDFNERLVIFLVMVCGLKALMLKDGITKGDDLHCPLAESKSRSSSVSERETQFGSLCAINSFLQ